MGCMNAQTNKRRHVAGRDKNSAKEKNRRRGCSSPPVYFSSLITRCVSSWNCLTPSYSPFTTWHRNHLLQEALHVDPLNLRHTATPRHRTLWHGQRLPSLSVWVLSPLGRGVIVSAISLGPPCLLQAWGFGGRGGNECMDKEVHE